MNKNTDSDAYYRSLIETHGYAVLSEAKRILNNHHDALEVSQETFLAAFTNRGKIREPDKIGSWLRITARNKSLDLIRKKKNGSVVYHFGDEGDLIIPYSDPVFKTVNLPEEQFFQKEKREKISRLLLELTNCYRIVLEKYYLEGSPTRQIADELAIPQGTVKWRLSEARNQLRRRMIMTDLSDGYTGKTVQPAGLNVGTIWGKMGTDRESVPQQAAKSLLAQQILYSVKKKSKSAPEISRDVNAGIPYVEDQCGRMTDEGVLHKTRRGYRADCIIFDSTDEEILKETFRPNGERAAQIILGFDNQIVDTLKQTDACRRNNSELQNVKWIIIGILVLNLGIDKMLRESGKEEMFSPPPRPDGGEWFFLPSIKNSIIPAERGCNMRPFTIAGNKMTAIRYHNRAFTQGGYLPDERVLEVTAECAGDKLDLNRFKEKYGEEVLAAALDNRWIIREGDILKPAIPVFSENDGKIIHSLVTEISGTVVDQVFHDYPDRIYKVFDKLGFGFMKRDYPVRARGIFQWGSVSRCVDNGVLVPPGKNHPQSWGTAIWMGGFNY
jgi:RNA polymerase sigma-70 factor (ECF subfamily)